MANSATCGCGCGEPVAPPKRFVRGHWSRTSAALTMYESRRESISGNVSGICQCGCGQPTPIASNNHPERGYYRGQHVWYLRGHSPKKLGRASHRWNGGRTVDPNGYVLAYAPDHPHANSKGYVYEHRLVMERRLGRLLEPHERVHHINHRPSDNRAGNLRLYANHSEHIHDEHRDRLSDWRDANPDAAKAAASKAGRLGAEARWRHRKR
jgi:hypothetical protein